MNTHERETTQGENAQSRHFADRLVRERERLGQKAKDWAVLMDVTQGTQSAYENARRIPDALYLIRACELGMDACYLLTGVRAGGHHLSEPAQQLIDTASRLSPKAARAMQALIETLTDEKAKG